MSFLIDIELSDIDIDVLVLRSIDEAFSVKMPLLSFYLDLYHM